MPTRGAKPVPTNLKVLRGTLRPGRSNANEPKTAAAIPSCPRNLTGEARKEWRRVSKELGPMGLLSKIDRAALALYCEAWGRWIDSMELLKKYGLVIKSPSGFPMQSPYLAIANKAADQVRLLLGEFGMSPASRTRVHAEALPDEADEFARRYLRGGP